MRYTALAAIATLTVLALAACGGASRSEQALVAVALNTSDRLDALEDVEAIATEICTIDDDADVESSVVFETAEDAAIASVFCPDIAADAVTRNDAYLADLESAGIRSGFPADRAAVVAAERTCEQLDDGAEAQGSEAQQIAVDWFCPDYSDAFAVLEVTSVSGSFTLIDADERFSAGCSGDGGYSDLNGSTAVIIRDRDGTELGRTDLGSGRGTIGECTFNFIVRDISEGAPGDVYVLEVGDRGEISYSFLELQIPGAVALSIGG